MGSAEIVRAPLTSDGSQRRLFSFGIVSDIQYADVDDAVSFHGVPRFYRNTLVALRQAVSTWRLHNVNFAVHFGDIIDVKQPRTKSEEGVAAVKAVFDVLGQPVKHIIGNHCLYNLSRAVLVDRLGIASPHPTNSYYSFTPHPKWRMIFLDTYDLSMLGWPEEHEKYQLAKSILDKYNPNENKHSPAGMEGLMKRFVVFGGGCGAVQLQWLQDELKESRDKGQLVFICCHVPLYPGTAPEPCLTWNYDEVLAALQSSGNVVATMSGHAHGNGYALDDAGIHHIVLPAVLETPPGRDASGIVDGYADRLELRGWDCCPSMTLWAPDRRPKSCVK